MTLKSSLVFDPSTSIEVFFDNIIEVGTTQTREIMTYDSSALPEIKTFARNRHPSNTAYQGHIQSDIIEKKRKLIYLNAYADNVIVIDGGNENAIYGNINPLDISDRNTSVSDLSFTAVAKGGITGQYIPIGDTTSTGASSTDVDAVDDTGVASTGSVELLDASGEIVHHSITQNNYEIPEGYYKLFARLKDSAQVADDVKLEVYNSTDVASIVSDTYTATAGFTYFTLDFTIGSTDVGDSIRFSVEKATGTANTMSVDFFGFVKV